ncbi:MAG: HPr family phosphocarrier protein [Lachnospiraceae bacterium]|nr:HPr family phosphocarrier protein [Lachnospiraceae bacterium]
MTEFKYVITDELGIHARPAGMLVKEAKKFASTIKLATAAKTVDAKGIMGVMSLGAKKGDEVTITADGADEADAAAALEAFFKANL